MSFVHSIVKRKDKYELVKIEAKLNKGLPRVSVVGMPESLSKGILLKVKSAIVNQGFDWLLTKHLVISVEPQLKSGGGEFLDLGFATAILQELGLVSFVSSKKLVAAGSMNLDGALSKISVSEEGLSFDKEDFLLGSFKDGDSPSDDFINIDKLNDLGGLKYKTKVKSKEKTRLKIYPDKAQLLSPDWVELFEILTHGEHSCIFLMPETLELQELLQLIRGSLNDRHEKTVEGVRYVDGQRPFVRINSSVSRGQILGKTGEGFYHYAHGGMAYLDNLCALSKLVRDAIRQKVQGGGMALGERADTIIFSRNPLCPCGKAKLGKPRKCGFSLYKCRSVLEKLSMDELSLFQIVTSPAKTFFELYPHPEVDMESLRLRKEKAFRLMEARGQVCSNANLGLFELKAMMSDRAKRLSYIPVVNGLDRTQAILSVARSFADFEESKEIEEEHVQKAVVLAYEAAKEVSRSF